jgi:hypothetical protein
MCLFVSVFYYMNMNEKRMSKSTPISQLPSSKVPDDLMLDDDDATVQEVLNQISQSQPSQGPNGMMNPQEMMHQQQMQKFSQQMQMNPQLTPQQMFSQGPQMMPQDYVIPPPQNSWSMMNNNNNNKPALNIDVDMKMIFLVIAITAFVQIAPLQNIVYKYLSIDHIPYSSVMIKSVVAGLLFFFAKKYFG